MLSVASPIATTRIDRVIKPLVENLNRLPNFTTTSSCQGHYDRRRPYVAFTCDDDGLRLILKAVTVLNSEEPRQLRSHVEIHDYGEGALDVVLRFHHPVVRVKPWKTTVQEWHRRICFINELVVAELESGFLRNLEARSAFCP